MNINCPHCSAYLTVPEQYAGQLMKCPKCSSNFTVPALPPIDHEHAPPASPAPASTPAAPSLVPPSASPPASPVMAGHEPIPFVPEVPAFHVPPPEPAFSTVPPAAASAATGPVAAPPAPHRTAPAPERVVTPSHGAHSFTVPLPFRVFQWVPVGAAVLLFILQFFPWVGVYPGGVPAVTQDAWQVAFGTFTVHPDTKRIFAVRTEAEAREINEKERRVDIPRVVANEPRASVLMVFYLLLLFLPALLLSIAIAVLPYLHVNLPPAVTNLLPWRWAIIAVLNLLMLLFLGLYVFLNFGLESSVTAWAQSEGEREARLRMAPTDAEKKFDDLDSKERNMIKAQQGICENYLCRTPWWRLALLTQLLSTLAACLVYWMDRHHVAEVRAEAGARW